MANARAKGRLAANDPRVQNDGMPQTTKDRQESLRARRAMLGQTEVRGIYLPPELHAEVKQIAKKMLEGWAKKAKSDIVLPQ